MLLVGIEPERIEGVELLRRARALLDSADALQENWRAAFTRYRDAKPEVDRRRSEALDLLPPIGDVSVGED